jgi:hypothetical protein
MRYSISVVPYRCSCDSFTGMEEYRSYALLDSALRSCFVSYRFRIGSLASKPRRCKLPRSNDHVMADHQLIETQWYWQHKSGHENLGATIMGFVFIITFWGWRQHQHWQQHQENSWRGHVHKWQGRIFLLLVFIVGFIPNVTVSWGYGAPAIACFLIYLLVIGLFEYRRRRQASGPGC